jgi:hypothetical protein
VGPSRSTPTPRLCWELADEKIRELSEKIRRAEAGEYDGNPDVMRDSLDKWLEYRHAHAPDEERLPL